MLHKTSEVRGWTHSDMLMMDKEVFYRYYGYWYSDRLNEEAQYEREKATSKMRAERGSGQRQWKH